MNRWVAWAALLFAIAGALALRLPMLDARPLHNDEGVNAIKVHELWQHGHYRYDPDEFHGPILHYASLPFFWLSGARTTDDLTDAVLRLAPVAFGAALILLLPLFGSGLGRHAIVWAGLFIAISPAMVFYSRYFIHEMLLVFFTALALGAGWRWYQTRRARWAVITGLGVGLMCVTKETFVITLAAVVAGLVATVVGQSSRLPKSLRASRLQVETPTETVGGTAAGEDARPTTKLGRHAALTFLAAFVVWLLFFSSFFANWRGLLDSVLTYLPWLKRAGGASPHIHPWYFYLERLAWFHPAKSPVWSEGLILVLAAIGAGVSIFGKKTLLHRFLVFFTLALTAAYCVIPYKTPWCLLNFWLGMILLAGIGAAAAIEFFQARAGRAIMIALLLAASAQLAWQAWRASFVFFADRRNPYVYAQTVPNILKLVQRVEAVADVAPTGLETVVKVIAPDSDYGPLHWYLRRLKYIGWYDKLPDDPFAPMIIVSAKLDARLDDKSDRKWVMVGLFEQRPAVFLELYVELELWKKFVETLPREL